MKLRPLQSRKPLLSNRSSLWPHHEQWHPPDGGSLCGQLRTPQILPNAKCQMNIRPAGMAGFIFHFSFFIFGFVLFAPAATTNSSAANPTAAQGPAVATAVLPPPPQSVFVMPKKATEGRDPFFPNATRVYLSDTEVKPKGPVAAVVDLSLKGISGTAAEPLAIINTTTFTTGEENDVITTAGRMRVRCVEINMLKGTVLVQAGGERRELRLQSKK